MQKIRCDMKKCEDGVIALEACISLTLFLIVMLALYSIIGMFTAQSMISHSLQQAGQSIALENYKNTKMDVKTMQKVPLSWLGKVTGGWSTESNNALDVTGGSFSDGTTVKKSNVENIAKKRFLSYLGGNGKNADAQLKALGVVGGVGGVNFEGTKLSGDDLIIQVSYKIRLVFYIEMFHFGEFDSTQSVCCRLWK